MYQLLKGVAHMHKHGVMHRDLKPQNLLVRMCAIVGAAATHARWPDILGSVGAHGAIDREVFMQWQAVQRDEVSTPPHSAAGPQVDDSGPHPLLKVADLGLGRHFVIPIKAYTHEVGRGQPGHGRRPGMLVGSRCKHADCWAQVVHGCPCLAETRLPEYRL